MSLLARRGDSPQDRFATELLELFRADGRTDDAWYDREQFAISVRPNGGPPVWAGLTDLYQEWGLGDAANRAKALQSFVDAAVEPTALPDTWEEAKSLVRPALRGITAALPPNREPESGALWRHAYPYLAEIVVLDDSSTQVSIEQLSQWDVSAETVLDAARRHLASQATRPQFSALNSPRVLRLVDDGRTHFVAQLMLDSWLAGFGQHLGARPVAFVPDGSTLLIAPDEPSVLASLFEMAEEEYGQASRPVSPMAYTVTDAGRVLPYTAPAGHPLHVPVGRAERVLAAAEYGRQKRWLEEAGSPHRTGSVMLSGRADASIFSVGTLAFGKPTLLPRTDYVAVTDDDAQLVFLTWESAEQIFGLVPEPNLEPSRFLADPAEVSQDALRAASVNPSA